MHTNVPGSSSSRHVLCSNVRGTTLAVFDLRLLLQPTLIDVLLQRLWLDGNLMKSLPASLGALSTLDRLSAVGNHLEELPESIGDLQELKQLELAGNRLQALPASLGNLSKSISASGMQMGAHLPYLVVFHCVDVRHDSGELCAESKPC